MLLRLRCTDAGTPGPKKKLVEKANPIGPRNTELITKFENYLFTQIGKKRITKYILELEKIAEWLDMDKATRDDIEKLVRSRIY